MRLAAVLAAALLALRPTPAGAILDIEDKGPVLDAGNFVMRVTNIGAVGNPFFDIGRSFDPSFEYPKGSGVELLHDAELWVGARNEAGDLRVSGGPLLEWRPTLDPTDHVYKALAGDPRGRWNVDDDGDGKIDEELLNGKDDDGDGKIDEDFAMSSDQLLGCDYTDDQPEAVNYTYPNGERHEPLGLSVHQEVLGWGLPADEGIAGMQFTVTNHGTQVLRDVRLGLLADLDVRDRNSEGGHLDDEVAMVPYSISLPVVDAFVSILPAPPDLKQWTKACMVTFSGSIPCVHDRAHSQAITLVPLTHTTDPLGYVVNFAFPGAREAAAAARAPRRDTTFHFMVFANDLPPGSGGPPNFDADRYAAMAGTYPTAPTDQTHDYNILVSCGPFARLDPGQSVEFRLALVAAPTLADLPAAIERSILRHRGTRYNLKPDTSTASWLVGETGINGHEICYEPPPGITFNYDPHCPLKFYDDPNLVTYVTKKKQPPEGLVAAESTYAHGHCIWTDFDCDLCTGDDGTDTARPWQLDFELPPPPGTRVTAGDHAVTIAWDNAPEIAVASGAVGQPGFEFAGYKLYRLDNWARESLLPAPRQWQRLAVYRPDTSDGSRSLAAITDSSLAPSGTADGLPRYPVGRYRVTDETTLDGFDYQYVVTSVIRNRPPGAPPSQWTEAESPFTAVFDAKVVPHAAAQGASGRVWVVPNPYRGRAAWERPPVPGDVFTRHVDFLGLPRARAVIRIYTVAGDLVQTLAHDGTGGDGQQPWNLISRNGQDVESGIYLFTVDSPLGHQVGKFVVIR